MTWRARALEEKLPKEALYHFVKALQTDRMIAVTGSMVTRALGYPSWPEFCLAVAEIARELKGEILNKRGNEPRIQAELCLAVAEFARGLRGEIHGKRGDEPRIQVSDRTALRLFELIDDYANAVDRAVESRKRTIDLRVTLWRLYDVFGMLDTLMLSERSGLVSSLQYHRPALQLFEERIARMFEGRVNIDLEREPTPVHQLIAALGIKRYVTLNYDFELEAALMLRADEREFLRFAESKFTKKPGAAPVGPSRTARAKAFAGRAMLEMPDDGTIRSFASFVGDEGTGKPIIRTARHILHRRMTNGHFVESNIVDRERPDRLLEFSIGSTEVDRHILHLHGRADAPESLVAHIRQYDRLYRLDDLYRDPFDYGLKVLFGGNPILFVGVGMSEPEVNQTLQYFVSNSPLRRPAPLFLLWTASEIDDDEERKVYMHDRRTDWWSRLGVRVIFDEDLVDPDDGAASATAAEALGDAALAVPPPPPADSGEESEAVRRRNLVRTMAKLPDLVTRLSKRPYRREWQKAATAAAGAAPPQQAPTANVPAGGEETRGSSDVAHWRSLRGRLELQSEPVLPYRLWGPVKLLQLAKKEGDDDPLPLAAPGREATSSVLFAYADVGYGRGKLAELIGQMSEGNRKLGKDVVLGAAKQHRLIIHAGFSYDSDAMLNGIAHFLRLRMPKSAAEMENPMCRERHFADGKLFNADPPALIVINGADRFFGLNGMPLSAELDHLIRCALAHTGEIRVQFLLLGTQRIRPYVQLLGKRLHRLDPTRRPKRNLQGSGRLGALGRRGRFLDSLYLNWVAHCFAEKRRLRLTDPPQKIKEGKRERCREFVRRTDITPAAAAVISRAIDHDRDAVFRHFFAAYLSPLLLENLGIHCPETFEVLRTLSFIGAPVEAGVLLHAPKVWAMLAENPSLDNSDPGTDMRTEEVICTRFADVIEDLIELGLVLEVDPHHPLKAEIDGGDVEAGQAGKSRADAGGEQAACASARAVLLKRIGLHRSLATYLRDQHGAPINDAKLATTFNMSLFMSEQGDNYTPEPSFHQEIGILVDSLIGAWHDVKRFHYIVCRDHFDETSKMLGEGGLATSPRLSDLYIHPQDRGNAAPSVYGRSSREAAACLRAALLLVRGYFSTGTLLKLDTQIERNRADRDGALTEHAARIDRMLESFGNIGSARTIFREALGRGESDFDEAERNRRRALVEAHMGPAPFYADDLIWLFNERGVIAMAQGQLFEARDALSLARDLNRTEVETDGYFGHNARRIAINMVGTQLERGKPKAAAKLLDSIDLSINDASWCRRAKKKAKSARPDRVARIRALFGNPAIDLPMHGTAKFTREEMMIVGMTTGYRGLTAQQRGKYHEAGLLYDSAIAILRSLGEQRVQAHFERHRAILQGFFGDFAEAQKLASKAMAVAQAARQMDILHRTRVVWANYSYQTASDAAARSTAIENIK